VIDAGQGVSLIDLIKNRASEEAPAKYTHRTLTLLFRRYPYNKHSSQIIDLLGNSRASGTVGKDASHDFAHPPAQTSGSSWVNYSPSRQE
jgi:hypothetical protein